MYDLITSASNKESNSEYTFYIDGDLCQMSNQKRYLQSEGFDVRQNDVYPCLKQSDVLKALTLIYKNRVDGYWHYWNKYMELGIATKDDLERWRKSSV